MSSQTKIARQNFDESVWDRNDDAWEEARKKLGRKSLCRRLENLTSEQFGRLATWIPPMVIGGFNNLYQFHVEGITPDVFVRRPSECLCQLPQEKTLREAATAKYIQQKSNIPTPRVHFYSESSAEGPFMIIDRIEHKSTLSHVLTNPGADRDTTHALDPNISQSTLEDLYLKLAKTVLQLSSLKFPFIGSLTEADDGSVSISGRPVTQNMNDGLQLANIPPSIYPPKYTVYKTADEYYISLAQLHIAQLVFQHNDIIESEDDCRNKYVARHLFLQLAKQGRLSRFGFAEDDWSAQSQNLPNLSPAPPSSGSFRLYGDDFRPSNILINEANEIVSVLDWEYTYSAPSQFVLDPPWWLLLDHPETWEAGIDDWTKTYKLRVKTWLSTMAKAEEAVEHGNRSFQVPLSTYQRESWETGRFWLSYAARKSWAFDTIFWKYLDERFFGPRTEGTERNELWRTRIDILSGHVKDKMEAFVNTKMEEKNRRKVVHWEEELAKKRFMEVLGDTSEKGELPIR